MLIIMSVLHGDDCERFALLFYGFGRRGERVS